MWTGKGGGGVSGKVYVVYEGFEIFNIIVLEHKNFKKNKTNSWFAEIGWN